MALRGGGGQGAAGPATEIFHKCSGEQIASLWFKNLSRLLGFMGAGGSRTSKDDTQDDGLAGTPPKDKDPAGGKFAGIKQKWSKRKLSTIVSDEIRETNRSRVDLMNEAQIDEFREAFTQFDIDKSG